MYSSLPHVIAYHKITSQRDLGINCIKPETFERHINIILDSGFTPVTFLQLFASENSVLKPLVLTFDDGYESVYKHAFPILIRYKFPAVIYIISNYIGKKNDWESFPVQRKFRHLTTSQISELMSAGWEIGSHTRNHHYLPALNKNKLIDEISGSKIFLEERLNTKIISFCYPYGQYNRHVVEIVQNSGYLYATSNLRLLNRANHPHHLIRRSIYATDSDRSIRQKLNPNPSPLSLSYLNEWVIQRGTIPGIFVNTIQNLKY